LLIPVPLDALQESTQRLLLFLPKKCLLGFDDIFDALVDKIVVLLLLELLTLHLQQFRLFVSFLER